MQNRTYLNVTYNDKDAAKQAGAKWDKETKSWYAPEGVDQSALSRWLTPNVEPVTATPEQSFANALRNAGLVLDGLPTMDGKLHRVPVEGELGGKLGGAYAGHLEGRTPGGYIQNFKTGEEINWKYEGKVPSLTPDERAQLETHAAERKQQRQTEKEDKQAAAADAARALWYEATRFTTNNAYAVSKGFDSPSGVRVVPDAVSEKAASHGIKIAANVKEAKALRDTHPDARVFMAGDLLIPGYDQDGRLCTLQSVNPSFKSFMKDGKNHGVSVIVGVNVPKRAALLKDQPLVVTEGWATGQTVSHLLEQPVTVAFTSGNLDAVVGQLRERYPDRTILIAGDNDHENENKIMPNGKPLGNAGAKAAKEVAKKYGAGVMLPPFAAGKKGSDWNDYAKIHGDEAAKKQINQQMRSAKIDAALSTKPIEPTVKAKIVNRDKEKASQGMEL